MRIIYLLIILCCFSCDNERVLLLPEIENAEITEVLDVSPAYIFYDETQPDSTLLNRKNLIITTNWLVNVDKRLTLKQAIPHIKFLQDKKRNAEMHKNEAARNYFSCNDISIENLGFMDFTDTSYKTYKYSIDFSYSEIINEQKLKEKTSQLNDSLMNGFHKGPDITQEFEIKFNSIKDIYFGSAKVEKNMIQDYCNFLIGTNKSVNLFYLKPYFDENMTFQDYISIKSELSKLDSAKIIIDSTEFIY
ncbi:hypothetical protein [uncultured Winogradskyella sp.]|uniref:hypothetical protein n=1 Tax=uncultured Winogradskyella sp. TaxID=395353 RepID=UPI002631C284|nr:hypothetical protein [uncultured Winogradskyella sp.]